MVLARILRLLLAIVAGVVIVMFSIANREPTPISFAPLPYTVQPPLYVTLLIAVVAGVVLGGLVVWLGSIRGRVRASRERERLAAYEDRRARERREEEEDELRRARERREAARRAETAVGAPSSDSGRALPAPAVARG